VRTDSTQNKSATPRYITMREVCQICRVQPNTIRRWGRESTFPQGYKIGAHRIVWDEGEIHSWIKAQRTPAPK
jgi:predicted DNA-binding transcriptional regulator AlpA